MPSAPPPAPEASPLSAAEGHGLQDLSYYLFPVALLILGGVGALRERGLVRRSVRASWVAIALLEVADGDGGTGFSTVVRFDADGQTWEMTDRMVRRPAAHAVGQQVTVYCPPADPSKALLRHGWVAPFCLFLTAVGAIWLCLAVTGVVRP